jgi:hypothetical protein
VSVFGQLDGVVGISLCSFPHEPSNLFAADDITGELTKGLRKWAGLPTASAFDTRHIFSAKQN